MLGQNKAVNQEKERLYSLGAEKMDTDVQLTFSFLIYSGTPAEEMVSPAFS